MFVVADEYSFLIGCEAVQTAPGSSEALKVPVPINPISLNPLFKLV